MYCSIRKLNPRLASGHNIRYLHFLAPSPSPLPACMYSTRTVMEMRKVIGCIPPPLRSPSSGLRSPLLLLEERIMTAWRLAIMANGPHSIWVVSILFYGKPMCAARAASRGGTTTVTTCHWAKLGWGELERR